MDGSLAQLSPHTPNPTMLFTTLSLAFLAASAAAHADGLHKHQHLHPRFYNATSLAPSSASSSAAGGELTTLTIFTTTVHTVTSCAASITNCPARASGSSGEIVVTDTIALTTTVCPVSEAESISSALASHAATATNTAAGVTATTPSVPLGTGASSGGYPTGGASPSGSVVLTYTLGAGTSTTVITTTVLQYSTQTVYATLPGGEAASSAPVAPGGPGAITNTAEGVEVSSTTTYTSTWTSTKYITVLAPSSAAAGGVAPSGPAGACSPVTVTVTATVTQPAAPVATESAAGTVALPSIQGENVSTSSGPVVILSTVAVVPVYPTTSTSDSGAAAVTSTTAIVPPPISSVASYPYSNGTATQSGQSGYPGSSGFISRSKPTHKPSHIHSSHIHSGNPTAKPTETGYPTYPMY